MTKEQALGIINKENLRHYNINEERYNKADEIGICQKNGHWIVYATDERASIVTGSEAAFKNESDAWDNFVMRLRADKELEA